MNSFGIVFLASLSNVFDRRSLIICHNDLLVFMTPECVGIIDVDGGSKKKMLVNSIRSFYEISGVYPSFRLINCPEGEDFKLLTSSIASKAIFSPLILDLLESHENTLSFRPRLMVVEEEQDCVIMSASGVSYKLVVNRPMSAWLRKGEKNFLEVYGPLSKEIEPIREWRDEDMLEKPVLVYSEDLKALIFPGVLCRFC